MCLLFLRLHFIISGTMILCVLLSFNSLMFTFETLADFVHRPFLKQTKNSKRESEKLHRFFVDGAVPTYLPLIYVGALKSVNCTHIIWSWWFSVANTRRRRWWWWKKKSSAFGYGTNNSWLLRTTNTQLQMHVYRVISFLASSAFCHNKQEEKKAQTCTPYIIRHIIVCLWIFHQYIFIILPMTSMKIKKMKIITSTLNRCDFICNRAFCSSHEKLIWFLCRMKIKCIFWHSLWFDLRFG